MKHTYFTFFLFLALSISAPVWGQKHTPQVMRHDTIPAALQESGIYKQTDYWKKRNLMVGIGSACLAVGAGEILFDIAINQMGDAPHGINFDNLAPVDIGLLTTGSALVVASVWCFVQARQYRNQAIDFSIRSSSIRVPDAGGNLRAEPALAFRLTF